MITFVNLILFMMMLGSVNLMNIDTTIRLHVATSDSKAKQLHFILFLSNLSIN